MQRIKALIEKLNIQFQQKARPAEMLVTVQLLQKEITGGLKETEMLGSSNVSVLIPNLPFVNYPKKVDPFSEEEKVYFELPLDEDVSDDEITELLLQNAGSKNNDAAEIQNTPKPQNGHKPEAKQAEMYFGNEVSGAITEIPTFTQYAKAAAPARVKPAGNSKTDQPISQLKKAITDEDRQLFLFELFRGDEAMYERSIKTIDNFQAFAEAEFWIRRELKTKLGWLPDNDTVHHFDSLVRRRFA